MILKPFQGTKGGLLNTRSINEKESSIYELFTDNQLDFLAFTETWCTDKSSVSLGLIQPPGYSVIHLPRHDRHGGGVGLIYPDSYKAKRVKCEKFSSFEDQTVSLSCGTEQLVVTCVYLNSGVFTQDFSSQFSELLSFLQAESAKHLIVGDFNVHVNINTDVSNLKSFLHQFNLIQHVNVPTHTTGNKLDLVISRGDISVKDIRTDPSVRSNHFAVLFALSSPPPGLPKQTVTYHSWKSVDHDQLRKDIGDAFTEFTCSDVESAVHNYNEVLQNIVDKHAPEKTHGDHTTRSTIAQF